jgi:hypothetical protein
MLDVQNAPHMGPQSLASRGEALESLSQAYASPMGGATPANRGTGSPSIGKAGGAGEQRLIFSNQEATVMVSAGLLPATTLHDGVLR